MTTTHSVPGGGGLNLHVREWGNAAGVPLLLVHGWSANHMVWRYQYEGLVSDEFRVVALDLRGHGMSDAPLEPGNYKDAGLWAEDIAAIIDRLDPRKPVPVGWSYGGFIINDYVRVYGQSDISGINYVGGGVALDEEALATLFGPGFLDHVEPATSPDLPANIDAMRAFVRDLTAEPMSGEDHERVLACNIVVPPEVRGGMLARAIDSDDVLKDLRVPVLVTQGTEDRHVLPATAEHILDSCPTATSSWYDGVAHMPFMEAPGRFNSELAAFARSLPR